MEFDKEKSEDAIKRAIKGDQDAFSYLYEAYYKHTYMAAKEIIASHEECEDIVQEAFMRAFSKLQEGQMIEGFGSYIGTAAKNIAKDHIKAREAKKRPDEVFSTFKFDDKSEDEGEVDLYDNVNEVDEVQKAVLKASKFYQTPEEQFEEKELKEIIDNILGELPDYQQESLSLFYMEGMKYREIAELYGVSVDTIKSRVNQGKKKVEKKILELEKTKGLKLHGLAPIAVFFFILRSGTEVKAAELVPSGAAFVATKMAGAGTKKGIFGAIKSFFSKSVTVAGKTVSTKAIAVVTAGAIGIGGVGVAIPSINEHLRTTQFINQVVEYIESESYDDLYSYLIENENTIIYPKLTELEELKKTGELEEDIEGNVFGKCTFWKYNNGNDLYTLSISIQNKIYYLRMYENVNDTVFPETLAIINTRPDRYLVVHSTDMSDLFVSSAKIDDSTKTKDKVDSETDVETELESEIVSNIETITVESDTTDYVEIGGAYQNADGDEVDISMYTDGEFGGNVSGLSNEENLYIINEGENNVYKLSASWDEMVDTGYKIVVMSDESIRVFDEADEFVGEYKLLKRFES